MFGLIPQKLAGFEILQPHALGLILPKFARFGHPQLPRFELTMSILHAFGFGLIGVLHAWMRESDFLFTTGYAYFDFISALDTIIYHAIARGKILNWFQAGKSFATVVAPLLDLLFAS